MIVTTKNQKNNNIKTYRLDYGQIRLTNRAGVGISLYNLLKIGKNEIIINIEDENVDNQRRS